MLGAGGDVFCRTLCLLGGKDSWLKWGVRERGSDSAWGEPSCSPRRLIPGGFVGARGSCSLPNPAGDSARAAADCCSPRQLGGCSGVPSVTLGRDLSPCDMLGFPLVQWWCGQHGSSARPRPGPAQLCLSPALRADHLVLISLSAGNGLHLTQPLFPPSSSLFFMVCPPLSLAHLKAVGASPVFGFVLVELNPHL